MNNNNNNKKRRAHDNKKRRAHESDEGDNSEIASCNPRPNFNPRPTGRRRHSPPSQQRPGTPTPHFGQVLYNIPAVPPSNSVPKRYYDSLHQEHRRLQHAYGHLNREHMEILTRSQGESTDRTHRMQVQANAQLLAHNQRLSTERSELVKLKNQVRTQEETIINQNLKIQRLEAQTALQQEIINGKYDDGKAVEGHFRMQLKAYQRAAYELERKNQLLKRENNNLKSVAVMENFGNMKLGGGGNRKDGGKHIHNKLKLTF